MEREPVDRHALWRYVRHDWERMRDRAPDGYEPLVQVFLAGREAPVDLGYVGTRRGRDEPWVRLEAEGPPAAEDGTIPAERFWVHVHESAILRVEIIYRRTEGASLGFTYSETEEE